MELVIYSPKPEDFIEQINWNHEELKTQIGNELEKYKKLVFTPETLTDGKRTVADLRRLKAAMEDERKRVKAKCLEPYNDFEQKIKEITALIDEPINHIDRQIKDYEKQRRTAKIAECEAYFNEKAAELNLGGFIAWESVVKAEYGNVSKSMSSITTEIDEALNDISEALKIIDGMNSPYAFEMRAELGRTLDLQAAISKGQQLQEISEQKAKFEAERQAEQERRNAELEAKAKAVADAGKSSQSKEPEIKQEVLHTLCFQVTGTKEQLLELSDFMKAKNIKFEQIKEQ